MHDITDNAMKVPFPPHNIPTDLVAANCVPLGFMVWYRKVGTRSWIIAIILTIPLDGSLGVNLMSLLPQPIASVKREPLDLEPLDHAQN